MQHQKMFFIFFYFQKLLLLKIKRGGKWLESVNGFQQRMLKTATSVLVTILLTDILELIKRQNFITAFV
jgi:hypothetical protein